MTQTAEYWGGKLIAFLIVFAIFWILGTAIIGDYKIGFFIGILVAGVFVGVVVSRGK